MTSIDTDITFVALHRRYTGNLKETVFKDMMQKKPTEVFLSPSSLPLSLLLPRLRPALVAARAHASMPHVWTDTEIACAVLVRVDSFPSPPLPYDMTQAMRLSVRGMLPRNKLRDRLMKQRLLLYAVSSPAVPNSGSPSTLFAASEPRRAIDV